MPSGHIILAAYNNEDQFIVGNPQISHFRSAYIHHRPFATEYYNVQFDTKDELGQKSISLSIPNNGELINMIYIRANFPKPPTGYTWTNNLGYALIKEIRLRANNIVLDRQTGEWMRAWNLLSVPSSRKGGYNELVGTNDALNYLEGPQELLIPIPFWFCRHTEASFPLVSLQKNTLRLELDTRRLEDLLIKSPKCKTYVSLSEPVELSVCIEYVHLDRIETRWFVDRPQVYLIEQVQQDLNNEYCKGSDTIRKSLPFNGLLKELIFMTRYRQREQDNLWYFYSRQRPGVQYGGNFTSDTGVLTQPNEGMHGDIIKTAKIQYNGTDITPNLDAKFYRIAQPFERHTCTPDDFIYVYSWAKKPEEWNPSGHINMFRSTNTTLVLHKSPDAVNYPVVLHTYGLVYNILKIHKGMCGLEFMYA